MCDRIRTPHSAITIACRRPACPRKICACGRLARILCDHDQAGETCDAPLCERCAVHAGKDRHLCPRHAGANTQQGLFNPATIDQILFAEVPS